MKYIHTVTDRINDSSEIKAVTRRFLKEFADTLQITFDNFGELNATSEHLGYGAHSYIHLNRVDIDTKHIKCHASPFICISTEINPNGVTSEHNVARTYTLSFELKASVRPKFKKLWYDETILKFYDYSLSIEGLMLAFNEFVENKLNYNSVYLDNKFAS